MRGLSLPAAILRLFPCTKELVHIPDMMTNTLTIRAVQADGSYYELRMSEEFLADCDDFLEALQSENLHRCESFGDVMLIVRLPNKLTWRFALHAPDTKRPS